MRAVMLAAVVAVAASPALGAVNNRDIRAAVDTYAQATVGDTIKSASLCDANSTVVDEFAPHLWRGAGCAAWAKDFVAMERREGITACKVALGPKGAVVAETDTAYAVYPATVSCLKRGKPFADHGEWTLVLHKVGSAWKVASWTWSAQP